MITLEMPVQSMFTSDGYVKKLKKILPVLIESALCEGSVIALKVNGWISG